MAVFTQTGGSNGGTYAKYFTGRLTVWEKSYDIASNSSKVGRKLELVSGSSGRFSGYSANWLINVDGQTKSGSGTYESMSYNTAQTIYEDEITVVHNTDGSKKNMSCSATLDFASGTYSPGDFDLSGTMSLTTIPRASKVSATDANIGSTTAIFINRAVDTFTHTITYKFGNLSGTIATKTKETTVPFDIPTSFYEQIPNAKTGTVTLTCTTYNGSTSIGTDTGTFKVTASEDECKPDISAVLIDSNEITVALTGDSSKLIKYKSTAKITPTATAKNSASISKITVNGTTVEGGVISILNAQSETFTVTATDSRDYSNSIILEPDIIQYISLLATAKFDRLSATSDEVKVKYSGNYYNGSFGNEDNELTINWAYKIKDDAEWTEGGSLTPTIENNTFSGEASLGEIFDYKKAYEFILYIEDKLSKVSTQDTVKKGEPYFDYGIDADGENYLWVNGRIYENGARIIESGSNENGSWTKWSDGTMICEKTVFGTVDIASSTMGGAFYYGEVNLGSFPVEFIKRPTIVVSPQTQSGTQYFLAGSAGVSYGSASSWGSVSLLRPASRTGVAYVLDVVATGKWK